MPAYGLTARGGHLKFDLTAWCTPKVVIRLVGAVGVLFGAAAFLGYQVIFRMPDLTHDIHGLRDDMAGLHRDMKSMSGDLRGMKGLSDNTQRQLDSMNASLLAVRTTVLHVCEKPSMGKTCNTASLLTNAKGITQIGARFVDRGQMTLTAGAKTPQVTSQTVKEQLPVVSWGTMGVTTFYPGGKTKQLDVADGLLWSSAADSVQWRREGNTLKARFANGEAAFDIAPGYRAHATELLDSLNKTSTMLRMSEHRTAPK